MIIKYLLNICICAAIMATCACSTTAKVWQPYDKIDIAASDDVNPDGKGYASPIQLKVYELSSRSTFDNLDFERAYNNAQTLLSDELVSEVILTLQPNESIRHTISLSENTRFIAIIAGFIDIDSTRWKHVYDVNPFGYYNHELTLNSKGIIAGITKEDTPELPIE